MMKTVLIEKTSKKLKLYELIIAALLFITADRLRSIVHCHPACNRRMEHNRTMSDIIYRYPHNHLVVSWINLD